MSVFSKPPRFLAALLIAALAFPPAALPASPTEYDPNPANNTGASPAGMPSGSSPSVVYPIIRELMANVRITWNAVGTAADGQGRLVLTNSTTITFTPFSGNNLVVNGVGQAIPTGLTLTTAGASNGDSSGTIPVSSVEYIYDAMGGTSGAMSLEWSATGYTVDSYGRANKSTDATRRLVGMVQTDGSGNFLQVLSYFNRLRKFVQVDANMVTTSTSYVVSTANNKIISWADTPVLHMISGNGYNADNSTQELYTLYLDGSPIGNNPNYFSTGAGGAGYQMPLALESEQYVSEGVIHSFQFALKTSNTNTAVMNVIMITEYWG